MDPDVCTAPMESKSSQITRLTNTQKKQSQKQIILGACMMPWQLLTADHCGHVTKRKQTTVSQAMRHSRMHVRAASSRQSLRFTKHKRALPPI